MTSCGRQNVGKHREIKNGDKYIILDISYKLGCLDKRKVASLSSKDCMGRPGKGLTAYLDLRTKMSNKKQKSFFSITDITNQYFSEFIKKFNKSP